MKLKLFTIFNLLAFTFFIGCSKDDDDNKINNVILDNDIIMIWTNLNKEIKKISLRYYGATYVLKFNEE